MDIVDSGNDTAALFARVAEEAARGKSAIENHPNYDGIHCVELDCGVEIPADRRALGRVRCIDCQELLERRQQ